MAEERGKRIFSCNELIEIINLVRQKEMVDSDAQKSIRRKIRKIGLRWDEIVGRTMKFNLDNLLKLFENGILKVEGNDINSCVDQVDASFLQSTIKPIKIKGSEFDHQEMAHKGRQASDEHYVIDLCDDVLGQKALRQHRFDFLMGDTGVRLPVDAYYPDLNLVVEYYESQHSESTPFFDRKKTVSSVSRGEQRRIYDQRRKELLPKHGIKLVIISYTDFGVSKKLVRNYDKDLRVVEHIFKIHELKQKYE